MDDPVGPFLSSWSGNAASDSYNFLDDSVQPYGGDESIPPSDYFMRNTSAEVDLKFHENGDSSAIFTNGYLQNDSNVQSNFMAPGVLECNSTVVSFCPEMDTSRSSHVVLPHALSSSIESTGSELSAFLADAHAVSSASTTHPTFSNVSSFMEPRKLQAFNFQGVGNVDMLRKTCTHDGGPSQLDNVPLASLHDCNEFVNHSVTSFTTGQQMQITNDGSKTEHQEQNGMQNLNVPPFVSGNQMALSEAQGTQIPPKLSHWIHENINKHHMSHSSDVQPQVNSANGNGGGMKPRARARRGQATDPHSIAERLRREKISERMKNLQDLVPSSNKADKASMLDEIIDYVKFLQLQVKVLSMSRLGAAGAVLPLLTESQTEVSGSLLLSSPSIGQGGLDISDSEDNFAFEQEVVKLMETSVTTAMQYLQNKGLCLMPIALASAISNQKGSASAAIPPEKRKADSNYSMAVENNPQQVDETTSEDKTNGRRSAIVQEAQESINCARELKPRA